MLTLHEPGEKVCTLHGKNNFLLRCSTSTPNSTSTLALHPSSPHSHPSLLTLRLRSSCPCCDHHTAGADLHAVCCVSQSSFVLRGSVSQTEFAIRSAKRISASSPRFTTVLCSLREPVETVNTSISRSLLVLETFSRLIETVNSSILPRPYPKSVTTGPDCIPVISLPHTHTTENKAHSFEYKTRFIRFKTAGHILFASLLDLVPTLTSVSNIHALASATSELRLFRQTKCEGYSV